MRSLPHVVVNTALVLGLISATALAWGPRTNLALVTVAANLVSREARVPLGKLEKDIFNGALASAREMAAVYPRYETKPLEAIEAEMYLLQAVRGDRLAPYFAYRLGMLGKLVAQTTAPMARTGPTYRNLYYADVDENIDNVLLKPSRRMSVDPKDYFARVMQAAGLRDEIYENDYQEGHGFQQTAKASLSEDASRSIAAVADAWYNVLTGNVLDVNRSEADIRSYIVGALEYYIRQGREGYIDSTYDRLLSLTRVTPELHQRIGDMFYNAQHYDRAIAEYEAALALAPGNKDIAKRISEYYVRQGDEAMDNNDLEAAKDAFAKALEADPLHPTAEGKRLEADRLIAEREARLEMARLAIQMAEALWREADRAALQGRFAEAIALLQDAEDQYQQVTYEFPPMFKEAETALKRLAHRMRELKDNLVADAQNLSGSGFMLDVQDLAASASADLEKEALYTLVRQQFKTQAKKLRQDLEGAFEIR